MFELTEKTKTKVSDLERAIATKRQEHSSTSREIETHDQSATIQWNKMNFRERYLRGWFGGDTKKVAKYKSTVILKEEYETAAADIVSEIDLIDADIVKRIDTELRLNDISFQKLVVPLEAVQTLKNAIDTILKEIDEALSEVDEAETMETFDLVSSNAGISLLSYLENAEAAEEIEDVEKAMPAFQKALRDYNSKIKAIDVSEFSAEINDGWDLAFDLVFDGFDFMSIFTLSALDNAETQLKEVRSKVEEIESMADQHMAQAQGNVNAYITKARLTCA